MRLPQGRGNHGRNYNSFTEECAKRKGIITIRNKDNLCLPRALIVAKAHIEKDAQYTKIKKNTGKLQSKMTTDLINNAGVDIPENGCGIPELQQFQRYLKDYKIVVYQYGTKGRDVIFEGSGDGKRLNLLYHDGHYNVVISLTAAFCCSYYCEICHIPYNSKNNHRCFGTCPQCQQSPACPKDQKNILCEDCNRYFRGQQCLNNHKASGSSRKSVCDTVIRCSECLKSHLRNRRHFCGEYFCKICKTHVDQEHLCYIQPDVREAKTGDILYIFYDLESRQEQIVQQKKLNEESIGEIKQHEANLCIFQQRCDLCLYEENLFFCQKCKFRTTIKKKNVISDFLAYILTQRKIFKNIIVVAHNGQAYDHQFILNHILENTSLKPELIMRGTKIILMILENIKFLDSLNYFPMALSKLPKAFDLPPVLKKGYFPHYFNTAENENYIGPLPPIEYYNPNTMKVEERSTFLKWYEEHKNDQFDMQRDIVEYCTSDVNILAEACLKFRKLFLDECNVEPFLEATTIASACNLVYRRNFLKSNTIGIIPKNGYRYADNHSKEALRWLIYEEEKRGINIRHAAKGREAVVSGVKVDGYCEETKQVFEFHGCYFHGHPICLQHNRDISLLNDPNDTLNSRYEKTVAKSERLRELGYVYILYF